MKSNTKFIIGESGCGKTFDINLSVLRLNRTGERTIVLVSEFGGEYKSVCKATNGEYKDLSRGEQKINIMDFVKQGNEGINFNVLYAFSEAITKREITEIEKAAIAKATDDTFNMKCGNKPTLKDFAESMKKYPDLRDVSNSFLSLLEDPKCIFFVGDTNITISNLHTVISVHNFPIKYRTAAMIAAINYLNSWVKNNSDTHIFIDSGIMSMGPKHTLYFFAEKIKEISEYSKITVTVVEAGNLRGIWNGAFGREWELQLMKNDFSEKKMIEKMFNIHISPDIFAFVSNELKIGDYIKFFPDGSHCSGTSMKDPVK